MESFYLQSANEMLGLFRPGGAPQVRAGSRLPIQVVHVHEMAHRQLCDATSLGRYMTGLAILGGRKPAREERANAVLASTLQQCWTVHEGFATYSQMLECRRLARHDLVEAKEEYLRDSYLSALGRFECDEAGLEDVVREAARLRDPQAVHGALLLLLGYLGHIGAAAAMSIPIGAVLAEGPALTEHRTRVHIQRNAPDVRLDSVLQHLTPQFRAAAIRRIVAAKPAVPSATNRWLDDVLSDLVRDLCARAEISYEPADAVSLPSLLGQEGISVVETDARDLPIGTMRDYADEVLIHCGDDFREAIENPVPLDRGRVVHEELIRTFGHRPHVVCEIGSIGQEIMLFMHCFTSKAALSSYYRKTGVPEAELRRLEDIDEESPAKVWLMVLSLDYGASLPEVPRHFGHERWTWVSDYQPEYTRNARHFEILGRAGEVCAVALPTSLIKSRGGTRSRSSHVSTMPFSGTLFSNLGERVLERMPQDLCLHEFATSDLPARVPVVRLGMMRSDGSLSDAAPASFQRNCVAATIYQGFYSEAYRLLAQRGM